MTRITRKHLLAAAALAADKMAEKIGGEGEVAVIAHDQTSRTGSSVRLSTSPRASPVARFTAQAWRNASWVVFSSVRPLWMLA